MSTKPPRSYDEITRNTVVEPDSSMRPSVDQVANAHDGTHGRAADEQRLHAQLQAAVREHQDGGRVQLEVASEDVTLRGTVSSAAAMTEIEDLVRAVVGVGGVSNKLVVGS